MTRRPRLQSDQVAEILQQLFRLKPHFKATLPEGLAQVKQRLSELHPGGGAKRATDYDLFYRVSTVLFREKRPVTMRELAKGAGTPLSTATRMVDWMVRNSYAERLSDLKDRRIVRVALTKTGRELYQTIHSYMRQRAGQILRGFSASERGTLASLLRKMVEALGEIEE